VIAHFPDLRFRLNQLYTLSFNLTGTLSPGAVVKVTIGGALIAISSNGVKQYVQQGDGLTGLSFEAIIGTYTGNIEDILINGLDPSEFEVGIGVVNTAGHIDDAIIAQTGGPTINGGLATWYGKTPDEDVMDAERRWLLSHASVTVDATLNDMWFEFLINEGYGPGALSDMRLRYWNAGTPI